MIRVPLSAFDKAPTITTIVALACSTLFMSVTGGALKPYEIRAIRAGVASLMGDEAAAQALASELEGPLARRTYVHLVPSEPIALPPGMIDVELALLGPDLLGGPDSYSATPPYLVALAGSHTALPVEAAAPDTHARAPRIVAVSDVIEAPLPAEEAAPAPAACGDCVALVVVSEVETDLLSLTSLY
jgi:hypothetical protein